MKPTIINEIQCVNSDTQDDFLILSSSWENRCLGLAQIIQRSKLYSSKSILINVYDNVTKQKTENLKELNLLLDSKGEIKQFTNRQSNPLDGIKHMLNFIKGNFTGIIPKISFDISCFTRKHLLLLLNCLECNQLLGNTNFYYTQPTDYFNEHNSSNAEGINEISEIETFSGVSLSSRDTALILFLNFEGKRALSLLNELQPHKTLPIVPYPSIKKEWDIKVRENNKLLLSTLNINWDDIEKSDPLNPDSSKELLIKLTSSNLESNIIIKEKEYNYIVVPMGTKPQVLGIFKYWRIFPNNISLFYPTPIHYKEIQNNFATEHVWLIDKSINWEDITIVT